MTAEKQRELIDEILWRKDLPAAPAGEDFFAFGIIVESSDPVWNDCSYVIGNWEIAVPAFKKFMTMVRPVRCSISIFQGDDARKEIDTALTNEKRWIEQCRAQPFN